MSVAAVIALIIAVILLFFGCKKYRSSRRPVELNGTDRGINFSPQGSWRPPLVEDADDGDMVSADYNGILTAMQLPPLVTLGQSISREENEALAAAGAVSTKRYSAGGSAESSGSALPRRSSSHGQRMPGFGQAVETIVAVEAMQARGPSPYNSSSQGHSSSNLASSSGGHGTGSTSSHGHGVASSSGHGSSGGHGYSSTSSGHGFTSNSSGHGMTSASSHGAYLASGKSPGEGSRGGHSPVPPTSYRDQPKDSDAGSLRGLITRLRGGRNTSISIPDLKARHTSTSMESASSPSSVHSPYPHSPSSLLDPPPIPSRSPPPQNLRTGTDVAGLSPWIFRPASREGEGGKPWPVATMPPPLGTPDEIPAPEGLLHPRLIGSNLAAQPSLASLNDNVDYSRPIGGVRNFSLCSLSYS